MKLGHIFKIAIFRYETWQVAKVPEVAPSFNPRGSNLRLFSLYGQWFPRYGSIFKIAIFGHEAWPLAKVPEVAHIFPILPQVPNFTPFCSTAGQDISQFSIFPLGTMLNFNLLKKIKISMSSFLGGLSQGKFRTILVEKKNNIWRRSSVLKFSLP